jgi:membrane-bound metal-dependent hydrolase YbcI (DUF457 family)
MSSYTTHLLIGGVGGLALTRVLPPDLLPAVTGALPLPAQMPEAVIVAASAIAATWPDIDEPNSFAGRRVRWTITILTGLLLALVGMALAPLLPLPPDLAGAAPLLGIAGGIALGMGLLGPILGMELLRIIRGAAGGHRHLTHSLVVSVPLALIAAGCWWQGLTVAALVVGLLAWGQWLHLLGDLVTPAGVPLAYPLSDHDIRLLPRPLARMGEPLVAVLALLCAGWLLTA